MTSKNIQSQIDRLEQEKSGLEKQILKEQELQRRKEKDINRYEADLARMTSASLIRSKEMTIKRERDAVFRSKENEAKLRKKQADKNAELLKKRQELRKAVEQEGQRLLADETRQKEQERQASLRRERAMQERIDSLSERLEAQSAFSIFKEFSFEVVPNQVFLVAPFAEPFDQIYRDVIKPIMEDLGYDLYRGDDFYTSRAIIDDIWASINKSAFVIADLTGKNPNVFYEVGLSHALGKPVILISQNIDDIPFDLRHLRCIEYAIDDTVAFRRKLAKTVANLGLEEE